jgi:hypothetical protein
MFKFDLGVLISPDTNLNSRNILFGVFRKRLSVIQAKSFAVDGSGQQDSRDGEEILRDVL